MCTINQCAQHCAINGWSRSFWKVEAELFFWFLFHSQQKFQQHFTCFELNVGELREVIVLTFEARQDLTNWIQLRRWQFGVNLSPNTCTVGRNHQGVKNCIKAQVFLENKRRKTSVASTVGLEKRPQHEISYGPSAAEHPRCLSQVSSDPFRSRLSCWQRL